MEVLQNFFFVVFPYLAISGFMVGMYLKHKTFLKEDSGYNAQSEKDLWGYVPFHAGFFVIITGHVLAFVFPKIVLIWNSHPVRLIILELTAVVFGMCLLAGLLHLQINTIKKKTAVGRLDKLAGLILMIEVVLGCWVAIGYRWGSSWFAAGLSDYLWSIAKFHPQVAAVKTMPVVIQLHIIGAFILLLLIPFTRLAYFLTAPYHNFFKSHQ